MQGIHTSLEERWIIHSFEAHFSMLESTADINNNFSRFFTCRPVFKMIFEIQAIVEVVLTLD
jgi:hypothetical protein